MATGGAGDDRLADGSAAVAAEVRAPENRCPAGAARRGWGSPDGGCGSQQRLELVQPVFERDQLRGLLVDEVFAELVAPDHLALLSPIDDVRASGAYRQAGALDLVRDLLAGFAADRRRRSA